ncbi:serine hydrolase domain-containing protein [Antrihabitans cavernicola]|uniref:Beta-lactamase family protein n=1 Tax=Antrihabitans cavernicola TaxID=2495913 RepID=A0A5A7S120_9NOCA|nr:serine hydrolase domain-containing protein [Spelaeibacter cavernicola]KAA0016782.1 beta-lactamase family protein [Spelaeibacter cavernicola]
MPISRKLILFICALGLVAGCTTDDHSNDSSTTSAALSSNPAQADAVLKVVRDYMAEAHMRSVILRVSVDGKEIVTKALGESMTGVPATTDMHFRNGAVAISYVSTLLLKLVDEKKVSLDDKVSKYLPDLPNSNRVNLRQLSQMTSGYQDFVLGNEAFAKKAYADPFQAWSTDDQLALAIDKPLLYEPGTNWNYAHTNYVILGLALEKATGEKMADLLQENVLGPLGLKNTVPNLTAEIPQPVLHAFTSERKQFLNIPADQPFYEESTYWNPSWTINHGAIETTNIDDLHDTAVALGTGKLLSPESYKAMTTTDLRGKTTALPGCLTCRPFDKNQTYGLGVWVIGDWLMQNPLFYGYAASEAYLPSKKIAIAVAVTYSEAAFSGSGGVPNGGDVLFRKIGAVLAPDDAPPMK